MVRILVLTVVALGAMVYAGCSSSNDCESLAAALCSYDSFKDDKKPEIAEARKAYCTCVTDGPDSLDTDYQKMACRTRLAEDAALNPDIENDAKQLEACAVTMAVLEDYEDTYIKTCVQSGGDDACQDDLKACNDGCTGATSGESVEDIEGCLTACALQLPCDNMCG